MKQKNGWWLFALSLAVLLVGGGSFFLHKTVREALFPYQKAVVFCRRHVVNRLALTFSRLDLAARTGELQREVERLRLVENEAERLVAENTRLHSLLALPPHAYLKPVACPVLSRGGAVGWWRFLVLGKGSQAGIAVGAPVVVAAGLVGRVTAVSARTADVLLITDNNFRVACELETGRPELGGVRGILSGAGSRVPAAPELEFIYVPDPLRLRYLQRDFEPPPRSRVVTSGLGGGFPSGLTVGYVLESVLTPDGLYRTASVMPAADVGFIREVLVLVGAREGI